MKILANSIGKEYVRILKNDNGYVQDFSIEVISQKNETDLKNELQLKENELQLKKNELQLKENELQPLFVGEVDLAGISVLYEKLEPHVFDFYTSYDKFGSGGQVLHQVMNIPNLEVGFFNRAKAVYDLQNSLLNDLKKAKSTISGFRFSANKKGIMINQNALEFKILKEGTSYIYNAYKDYRSHYRTKYVYSIKKKRFLKKTIWESYYRVDVEWYIAFARDKFVNIANLFWKYEEFKNYLEKMRIFIELKRTVAELERENVKIQEGINNLL